MKIEKVLRKDEKNVVIYFDNNEKLIITEDVFFNSGLRKGDEVSEDRYSFFIEQNIVYHIKLRALSFLSRRFHSERELLIKLKSKAYDEKLIKIVLENLKQNSFINDKTFAEHFVEEKLKRKKWGKNKIKSALFTKGVSAAIIDEVLKMFDESENDSEAILEIATKKINQLRKRNVDDKNIYQKTISFLLGRGFDYEKSKEVCDKIIKMDFD